MLNLGRGWNCRRWYRCALMKAKQQVPSPRDCQLIGIGHPGRPPARNVSSDVPPRRMWVYRLRNLRIIE
jgi:hypothetical protein